jgi:signal transduction histidine kinase
MAVMDSKLAAAQHLLLRAADERQIEERLRDLLVPELGDALRLTIGRPRPAHGSHGADVSATAGAGSAARNLIWVARPPAYAWEAVNPRAAHVSAPGAWIASPLDRGGTDRWLLLEQAPTRSAPAADDLLFISEVAALAGYALASAESSRRLREARAAADAAAHRWSALARLSERVARSPDLDETLADTLASVVPYLADWAILDVLDPDGRVERRECTHHDPGRAAALATLRCFPYGPHGSPLGDPGGLGRLLSYVTGEDLEQLAAPHELDALAAIGVDSLFTVPLQAGQHRLGLLTLCTGGSGQHYNEEDAVLFRSMAHQAALALSTAKLYTAAHRARRAREEVLAIVSHDLKNPLNTIGFATALLRIPEIGADRRAEQLRVIERSVAQMTELIANLLDAAAIESGLFRITLKPTELDGILKEAVRRNAPLAERAGVGLEVAGGRTGVLVLADRARLLQVLSNLIDNALSLSQSNTRVTLAAAAEAAHARITVQDEGPGIEPHLRPHIFDRFWQARASGRPGTGLGLSIARGIVSAHGGEIGVEPAPGRGSIFHFTVPLAVAREAQS